MLNMLICPKCHFKLKQHDKYFECSHCNIKCQIEDEIPIMIPPVLEERIQKSLLNWENIEYDYDKFISQTSKERLQSIDNPLIDNAYGKVLEVGCGTARLKIPIEKKGCQYIGIDPSMKMLKEGINKGKTDLVCGVGEHLPFPDNYFDTIISGYHSFRYIQLDQGVKECA